MDLRESRTREGVRHPWETARASFLVSLLRRHSRLSATTVLDVGSGDGYLASHLLGRLGDGAAITCVDSGYDDATIARLGFPQAITARASMPDGRFDLVLALDVAEHVEDDVALLRSLRARTHDAGALLFTVPAWQALFSSHDRVLLHHRRYSHAAARALLVAAGYRVVEDGGFFHALVAPRILTSLLERLGLVGDSEGDTAWTKGEASARAIAAILGAEHRLTHALARLGVSLPGLSYYALAVPA